MNTKDRQNDVRPTPWWVLVVVLIAAVLILLVITGAISVPFIAIAKWGINDLVASSSIGFVLCLIVSILFRSWKWFLVALVCGLITLGGLVMMPKADYEQIRGTTSYNESRAP